MPQQPTTPDRSGQQFGDYLLLNRLGHGAFGEVYRARHKFLGDIVAIKLHYTNDIAEFLKEAQIIHQRLKHEHIVHVQNFSVQKVSDAGATKEIPYLVMDYAPNGTLKDRYPRGTVLSIQQVLPHIIQIGKALHFAHQRKVVHRDVKPENILLGEHDEALLSDFGIALEMSGEETFNQAAFAGTLSYMAPEQMNGSIGPANDQYALAVMVYEWITGSLPFPQAILKITEDAPSLRARNQIIAPDVETAIMLALSRDPRKRFRSVEAFVTALEQASSPKPLLPLPGKPTFNQPDEPFLPDETTLRATEPVVPPGHMNRTSYIGTVLCTYKGHQENGTIHALAWSSTGDRIASASGDTTVQVWRPDAPHGRQTCIYRDHKSAARSISWSHDDLFIASSSVDGRVHIWNTSTGIAVYTSPAGPEGVYPVAWAPDGTAVAFGCADGTVKLWTKATGRVVSYAIHRSAVSAVAWSPDSRFIASVGTYAEALGTSADPIIQIWRAADGASRARYAGHPFGATTLAWRPIGSSLASAGVDGVIHLWDTEYGNPITTYEGHDEGVNAVAWSPDGQLLASGGFDLTVRVWVPQTRACAFSYKGHADGVNAIAWSPNGERIASGGWDDTVHVWQAR